MGIIFLYSYIVLQDDEENDMEGDKKKKRKRKKKHKKGKLNIAYLGLHIMSK